ncbi:MAG TPA: NAD+ synthase [Ktedonobacterales bacterium]|nr:NAD+ synthase [Ktedonobacterales bacterium]
MARTNGSGRLNGARAAAGADAQERHRALHEPAARTLRLALAQIDAAVGDLAGNTRRIREGMDAAAAAGARVVCFPELALTGYPPEDLLLKPSFISDNLRALDALARHTAKLPHLTAVVGFVDRDVDIFNAAAVLHGGRVAGVYHKHFLPNYGVYDEDRYFAAGTSAPCFLIEGVLVGVSICEDIWYPDGPATAQASAGAELLLNISASPFHVGKQAGRERMLATRAADSGAIVAYLNLVGGQDELIFDGCSTIFDEEGELLARARAFAPDLLVADLDIAAVFRTRLHDPRRRKERGEAERALVPIVVSPAPEQPPAEAHGALPAATQPRLAPTGRIEPELSRVQEAYDALVLGVRDYVGKNGFRDVVIALSGGIDSALTATIAVDALGPEHVLGVAMPSRYSSAGSKDDAAALAANLGIRLLTLPIEPMFSAALATLAPTFAAAPVAEATADLTEQNLQARLRGNLLMALSNRYGSLVLTTGNKSEMAVGYATLYGDMAGGFAVLKDVFKTLVYELAQWRNAQGARPVIPASTIAKPPSAELRPDQRDEDSLPPYALLDPILRAYVEEDRDFAQIVALGFAPEVVRRTLALVDKSEYKRRQAPPGVKITARAFGRDRRLPLTSAYRGEPTPFAPAREAPARAKR